MDHIESFVGRFTAWWAHPDLAQLEEVLTRDVVLRQPLSPEVRGIDAARAELGRLLAWVPDLHGEVLAWAHRDGALYIELELRGTVAGRSIRFPVVDRFELAGDRARLRVTYADPLPIVALVARHPLEIARLVRILLGRRTG